jgi:hypothetical protein
MDEYKRDMEEFHSGKFNRYASLTDHTDPLYECKFAHNLPPPEAYFLIPLKKDLVSSKDMPNNRVVFFGWNNLTDFEQEKI